MLKAYELEVPFEKEKPPLIVSISCSDGLCYCVVMYPSGGFTIYQRQKVG
jgi:hypothetical protein